MNSEFATVRISPCLRIFIDSLLDGVDIASPSLMFPPEKLTSGAVTALNAVTETDASAQL